ncbi:MAG: transporter related protein [Nocardioides sp.]|jgi:ABC-type branched-subunit amino acid transport system ATPase component/ABC-type branched-subunit amino acid transport system permease subunit|nr:transporter related protein [Nocardioides sp.]
MDLLRFALIGLGTGAIYALLGLGLVIIYRGSGVINFAHSGFALAGGYVAYEMQVERGAGAMVSLGLAVVVGALLGLVTQLVVLRPLRRASPLARVIATLGLLAILTELVLLRYGVTQVLTPSPLPTDPIDVVGDIRVGQYVFTLTAIAAVVTLLLVLTASRTRLGHAISAASENPRAASALGWSPDLLAALTWSLGGALAGLAGGLFPSITFGFIAPSSYAVLIIGALAAALMAQFQSYPLALLGGLIVGCAQSIVADLSNTTGLADSVPFVFIIVLLVLRGRGLPLRGSLTDRMPRVGTGRIRPWLVVVSSAVAVGLVAGVVSDDWLAPVTVTTTTALVGLSVVVLTGYAGQLSIAQFALAGVGAFAAGQLSADRGWGFLPALVAGILAAALVGFLFGLPALRTRGVNLAVVTFGLGFALFVLVFSRPEWSQAKPTDVSLLGLDLDPLDHPRRYAVMCVVALVLVGLLVANLRRGRAGRRLLAVRTNERAAAAIGVNVFEAKLYAFTLSAAIAGIGGVLLAFSYESVSFGSMFPTGASINVLVLSVIGGVGFVIGPLLTAIGTQGGLVSLLLPDNTTVGGVAAEGGFGQYIPILLAAILIITLVFNQDGAAGELEKAGHKMRKKAPADEAAPEPAHDVTLAKGERHTERVAPRTLEVTGLTQRFGGFTALDDVGLTVRPGEVLGLLGPNGAGKTTLIDCVSGNNRITAGRITWDGQDISRWAPHRRSRAGLSRSFQSLELFDDLTVRENLLAAAERRDRGAYLTDLLHPGRPELPPQVADAVAELELLPLLDIRCEDLSYGQRRLVAIARAVAGRPSVLLLDEPAAGLDERESAELGRLIRRLAVDWGMGVLLIEHDVALVLANADRVVVLDFGRKIAEGTPSEISADPAVRRAYLGEAPDDDVIVAPAEAAPIS